MSIGRKRPKGYRKAWSGGSREAAMTEADTRDVRAAIKAALSEDGMNEDDAPADIDDSAPATAWVQGYAAGQNSVQRHLDAFRPSAPSREDTPNG